MSRLIGFKRYSFEDDKKALVEGVSLWFAKDVDVKNGKGLEIEKVSVSKSKENEVIPSGLDSLFNKNCHIQYNRFGKPEHISEQK